MSVTDFVWLSVPRPKPREEIPKEMTCFGFSKFREEMISFEWNGKCGEVGWTNILLYVSQCMDGCVRLISVVLLYFHLLALDEVMRKDHKSKKFETSCI